MQLCILVSALLMGVAIGLALAGLAWAWMDLDPRRPLARPVPASAMPTPPLPVVADAPAGPRVVCAGGRHRAAERLRVRPVVHGARARHSAALVKAAA